MYGLRMNIDGHFPLDDYVVFFFFFFGVLFFFVVWTCFFSCFFNKKIDTINFGKSRETMI